MSITLSTPRVPEKNPDVLVPALFSPVQPEHVHTILGRHLLVDGFDMVANLGRSHGSYIFDSLGQREFLDFFTFFGTSPVGLNHPDMLTAAFRQRIGEVAINNPSNSDVYTVEMADFIETFSRVGIPDYLPHAFFISGGTLAVENALKAAFDWKVRKNFEKGYTKERGYKIIHFESAFHGRSGYTLSLTNTNPVKTMYFPKFTDWIRIPAPSLTFPLNEERILDVENREREAIALIRQASKNNPDDIAAIIIEPIQAEGGDNHFRHQFLQDLRTVADELDMLLIFDEVQTGVGLTGKFWAHEHFVQPDILAFGKKMQVCGILAGTRIDEVDGNVFQTSSRINSTWGGNLTDMVRAQKYLEIIEGERLLENATVVGDHLHSLIDQCAEEFPSLISNPRGRGLMCAMDLPTAEIRDRVTRMAYEKQLIILGCGDRSIRFRPALNISRESIDEGIAILRDIFLRLAAA